jgi:hypothetical protein
MTGSRDPALNLVLGQSRDFPVCFHRLRKARGLTLADLATAAGCSPAFLSLVEQGRPAQVIAVRWSGPHGQRRSPMGLNHLRRSTRAQGDRKRRLTRG